MRVDNSTSSAARLHFSLAISCVVPWISGTVFIFYFIFFQLIISKTDDRDGMK